MSARLDFLASLSPSLDISLHCIERGVVQVDGKLSVRLSHAILEELREIVSIYILIDAREL